MLEQIKEIVAESLNVEAETLTTDTSFKEDLGADSLILLSWLWRLKKHLKLKYRVKNLEEIKTVGDRGFLCRKSQIEKRNQNEDINNKTAWN